MHRKFDVRRYLTAFFIGIFAVAGSIVAIDTPAKALQGDDSEIDYALSLGANQAIYAQDAPELDLSASFTMETWYKVSSNAERMILNKENAYEFKVTSTGKFAYALQYGVGWSWNETTVDVPTNQWVHLAFTKNGTTSKVYVNGQQAWTETGGSANPSQINDQTSVLTLGGRATGNSGIGSLAPQGDGLTLDEVKLWNTDRGANIATDMHAKAASGAAGLVAYWNFNEGTSSGTSPDVYDRSGQGNTLQFFGTPTSANGNFVDIKSTTVSNGRTIVKFPRTYLPGVSGWTVPSTARNANILVVAGGGGGGSPHGGGGGAGAVAVGTAVSLSGVVPITVGQGGQGQALFGVSTCVAGKIAYQGQASTAGSITVKGGGAGSIGCGGTQNTTGGSGGGGSYASGDAHNRGLADIPSSTANVTYYGNAGGYGGTLGSGAATLHMGGGGGGAGSIGANSGVITTATAGSGGAGYKSNISGSDVCYAAGGGGGSGTDQTGVAGSGGVCSGMSTTAGAGSRGTDRASDAFANTGSGGGGGGYQDGGTDTLAASGNGGSGIVIISYLVPTVYMDAQDANSLAANSTTWKSISPGAAITPVAVGGSAAYTAGPPKALNLALPVSGVAQTGYVNMGASAANISGAITVETWVKCSAASYRSTANAWNIIATHWFNDVNTNSGGQDWHLGILNNKIDVHTTGNQGASAIRGTTTLSSSFCNAWHHIAFTISAATGATLNIYLDGQLEGTGTGVSHTSNSADILLLGDSRNTSVPFVGSYGLFRMYNTALNGAEMAANYDAVKATYLGAQAPTIGTHPADITKSPGETADFTVSASSPDSGTLSYQWEVSANNGVNWLNVSGGSGATSSTYRTPNLVSADLGKKYRVVVTNTVSNGTTATTTSNAATLTMGLDKVNVNFDELNYDFSNVVHVVGANGKALGNKVLFLNVTTKNGIQVDSLVTTEQLSSATIANYESGTGAGGANSYFQVDVDFSAVNGFAKFKFDFYQHGVAGSAGNPCTAANPNCTGATKVILQNVNVSAIDIDYNQWNDFTAAESYTLASNTKLKECPIPISGTCTARSTPGSFPADMRFQGSADYSRTNDPVDMAIVTYADIETFRIKFGKSTSTNPNYYGVAFKALSWGSTTPQTTGGTNYTISYNLNSPSSGTQTVTHTGAAGSLFTVASAGTGVKTGYTFAGWATTANASTVEYAATSKITMPGSNLVLYAVWTAVKYTLTYNANGGTGAPAAGSYETGTNNVTISTGTPTRTGYVFGGWDTVINSGAGNVNKLGGAQFSMPASNTTLYAKWTVADGTLAYNANGGSTTQASVTAAGGSTTTVADRSNTNRSGYDFAGWNSKADGTGTSYAVGSTFTITANVTTTIYAQWTLARYNLVFNVNGGVGTPQSQSYVAGATTTMPVTNPTRDGYNFAGWNSAADGSGTPYNGSFLMPGNNLTLYAKWTPITYSVIYNNNSATYSGAAGTVTDSTAYTAATTVTVRAATGLTNVTGGITYRFIGWNTAANGSGTDYLPADTFSMPAANRTLFAMWVDASIEIAYNANGGTGAPANDNATINSSYTISSATPQRSGYTFDGWNVQDGNPGSGPHTASSSITPNSDEILVAQWTAINYTVSFNSDGGSTTPSTQTSKHVGDTITVDSTAPTKNGYTFLGWKDSNGNIYPAGGTFTMPAGNVTLTAQWQANSYALTYDANSGIGAPGAETRNYNAVANLSATEPTRTGYTFVGWNTLVGGGGSAYSSSASFTMPNTATTLYAQWSVNSFVLAYNTQGGSTAPSSSNKDYNASVTVSSTTPTKTGYTFAGWNTVAAGTGTTYLQSGTFRMPNANVTLYAQWTKTAYTLYYNTNGGQGVFSSQPIKYGESVTVVSTAPTKTGYSFSGWNTAADRSGNDHSANTVFTLNVESNVTLYAKWTAVPYTLEYDANGGSGAPSGGIYTYGASVTTASKGSMNLSGYRFIGWNTRNDGSGSTYIEGATFSMPAENVILYAQWIDSTFEIAYNANGGSGGPDGTSADDGTTYTVDVIRPVRPGYTFGGWKLADGTPTSATLDAATATKSFVVSGNELLVAQWTIKTINVTYDLNGGGGTTPSAQSGDYNTTIVLRTSSGVSRTNYQFVGWSTTPDGSGPTYVDGGSFTLPADDIVLYAKWAPIYYIIEYNPAGGTGEPADQYATPSTTVAIATQEPTKAGYDFEKWTEVQQGTDFAPGSTLTMPTSNVVLVANYTVRAASVPGSGSGSNTSPIDPETKPISQPKKLTLSVYFKGDSPVLTTLAKSHLRKLAAKAKAYGRANNVTIYGRVKETNDKSYDLRLSKARAANVAAYLKKYGVTGVFKVAAKGISPENTFRSRRVDMTLWWSK